MNKRVLIYWATGSQLSETLVPFDIFKRAGLIVQLVASDNSPDYSLSHDFKIANPMSLSEFKKTHLIEEMDALMIPGGKLGVHHLDLDEGVDYLLEEFSKNNKLIAAICAGPSILGRRGYLKDKNYTCYPGWAFDAFNGNYTGKEVERCGNLITARSMYYSADFALEVVEYLLGKDKRIEIEKQIKGIQ